MEFGPDAGWGLLGGMMFHTAILRQIIETQKECLSILRQLVVLLQEKNTELSTKVELLQREKEIAQNNFEWARVRLNHVEDERAALLYRVLALAVPTPKIERGGQESMAEPRPLMDDLSRTLSFEDVGDATARALGVDHEG